MIASVRVYKQDRMVKVGNEMIVKGEFDITKLAHWRLMLQADLDLENPNVPYFPEYAVYHYEYNNDKFTKIDTRMYTIEEIKSIVEEYYSEGICKGMNLNDVMYKKRELVEMRYVVSVVCLLLTRASQSQISKLYFKDRTIIIHGKKAVKNWYDTERDFRRRINDLSDILNKPLGEKIKEL